MKWRILSVPYPSPPQVVALDGTLLARSGLITGGGAGNLAAKVGVGARVWAHMYACARVCTCVCSGVRARTHTHVRIRIHSNNHTYTLKRSHTVTHSATRNNTVTQLTLRHQHQSAPQSLPIVPCT